MNEENIKNGNFSENEISDNQSEAEQKETPNLASSKTCKKPPTSGKKPNSAKRYSNMLRKSTLTALFIAFAVATKSMTLMNLSAFGLKINFSGIFTFFPAAIFGPLYGGIASLSSDIFGFIIKPDGAYNPLLSIMAFCGGFLKGVIWKLLTKGISNKVRLVSLIIFILVGAIGITGNVMLISDGILPEGKIFAEQTELPTRSEVDELELSAISKTITNLAMYNKDLFYISGVVASDNAVVLPSKASVNGVSGKVTRLLSGALSSIPADSTVYIPASITTVKDDVFGDLDTSAITIITTENSAGHTFAEKNNINFVIEDVATVTEEFELTDSRTVYNNGRFEVSSSDTYRKYLASYTNLAVAGTEFVMLIGIIFITLEYTVSRFSIKKKSGEDRGYLKIATSITLSGLFVTTVNTWILRSFLPAWEGRMFMILWIPRVAEELIVCMVQAYIISLLYGVIMNTKFKNHIIMNTDINR